MAEPFSIGRDSSSDPAHIGERIAFQRCEVEVSSRISLSRSLASYPFFDACSVLQRQEIQTQLVQCKWWRANRDRFFAVDCQQMKLYEQQFLIDLQAIVGLPLSPEIDELGSAFSSGDSATSGSELESQSPTSAPTQTPSAASANSIRRLEFNEQSQAQPDDTQVILILNGEDHLRIDAVGSGQQLSKLWLEANAVDDALQREFNIAFHDQFGFLTASPAETGTGLRASVLLHLPALVAMGTLPQVQSRLNRQNTALREAFGDTAAGDFFRISNLATLGFAESDLLQQVEIALAEIVEAERDARQKWRTSQFEELKTKSEEALKQLQAMDFAALNFTALGWSAQDDKARLSLIRSLSHLRLGLQLGMLQPSDGAVIAGKFQIIRLQNLLQTAIAREDYRAASRIRDRIKVLGEAA